MKTISFKNTTLSIFMLLMSAILLTSCGKSSSTNPSSGTSHKIVYTAIATNGAVINEFTYLNAEGQETSQNGLSLTTYTSPEVTIPASITRVIFVAQGSGTSASSTITVNISVDGVIKETTTSSGLGISAEVNHVF